MKLAEGQCPSQAHTLSGDILLNAPIMASTILWAGSLVSFLRREVFERKAWFLP